jgi:type 1 glutamine amidotransferase
MQVAVTVTNPASIAGTESTRALGERLGLDVRPELVQAAGSRVHVLRLPDGNAETTLLALGGQQRPTAPVDYPLPPGTDGGGAKQKVRPVWITLEPDGSSDPRAFLTRSGTAFDLAVRPAIRSYVDELARLTPISVPDRIPTDQRDRIAAAVPHQPLAAPKKSRKLLVLDLAYNGSFYHGATPLGNLSLQLMSDSTRAFTPIFSNDLENLAYPKIAQFDAVFLNQVQGDVFDDDRAIAGLIQYAREGGGVAGLHAATWASPGVTEFGELMGATSGAHKYNGEMGALRVDDPSSPLTRHFEGKGFELFDEFYYYLPTGPYSRAKLHVLLSLDPARADLAANQYTTRPDGDYGMVWIKRYGAGRVFNSGLGHRAEFYESAKMQQLLLAGIQFVLGDLEADAAPAAHTSPQ